ncbi:hypothetical protein BDN72DRAFT_825421 [Pluteus cervinus]|uniref:Uncharacterized protein n=1 Tax=Pluteus cervinus TaxID=181527 RepID=A0ACD3AFD0_9AGAR|nr:hypothetical protein BDN72DRAFT_825421 [Pluteus cervinus]
MHRISFDGHNGLQNYLDVWSVDLTHPFLWVSGCAGTGKTILARIMAEHWEREGRLAGNFFFSRSSEGRDTTRWFCQTILSQLPPDIQINTSALGQLAGRPRDYVPYGWLRITHKLASVTPPKKMIFVIDGLDECHSQDEQVKLLNALIFLRRFHPSFKILFFSRPEQHLEGVFKQFFTDKPPRVTLGESPEANDCIRTFLQQSFEKISSRRLEFNAISITDGSWPSSEMVDELVDRADGQFAYAASVVDVVDTPNRDPVRVLNQILERRSRSFKALDERYIAILEKVEQKVAESSLQLSQLMCNLLLHVISEPSSSSDIAKFWFTSKEVIDKLITHLDAVLVERDSGLIEYRHHSFHDFMSRPSLPNRFSLPGIHPVSKIFFFLRRSAMADDQTHLAKRRREEERAIQAEATCSRTNSKLDHLPSTTLPISRRASAAPAPHPELGSEFKALNSTQYLGYVFLNCHDRPPIPILYEEEARRLHRIYTVRDSTECRCLPNLWKVTSLGALRKFKPCRRKGCVIEEDLLTLCRMMELPVEVFKQEWTRWERTQFTPLVEVVKYLLWIRVLLFSMLNPLSALENTVLGLSNLVRNLDSHAFSIKSLIHGLIYGHLLLFLMLAFVNTGDYLVGYLYLAYLVITLLLQQLLRFDLTKVKHLNGFDAQWPSSSPPDRPPEAPKLVRYRQRT